MELYRIDFRFCGSLFFLGLRVKLMQLVTKRFYCIYNDFNMYLLVKGDFYFFPFLPISTNWWN